MNICLCEYVSHFIDNCRSKYERLITDVTGSLKSVLTMDSLSWYLIDLWPPTLWTGFLDLFRANHPQRGHLSLCDFYIAPIVLFGLLLYVLSCYYLCHCFYIISLVYIHLVIVFNFELWSCSCYLLSNIWCIGTEPYFTEEMEEDHTFQTFEPTDETEWDAEDGFGVVWACMRANVMLECLDELSLYD